MKYVKELEDKLEQASHDTMVASLLKQENDDLRTVIQSLQSENERLRLEREQALNFTWNPNGAIPSFDDNDFERPPAASVTVSSATIVLPYQHKSESPEDESAVRQVPQADSPSTVPSDVLSPTSTASSHHSSPASMAHFSSPPSSLDTPPASSFGFTPLLGSGVTTSDASYFDLGAPLYNAEHFQQPQFQQPQFQQPHVQGLPTTEVVFSPSPAEWDLDELLIPEVPHTPAAPATKSPAISTSSASTSASSSSHETTKRTLEEAHIYANMPIAFKPVTLSKDIDASRDQVETEICELFKKVHCKDKNPELAHGSKFIKKAM